MQQKTSWQMGRGDLAKLTLSTAAGASADIYSYAAHVTSWQTAKGKNWIFLSERALFANGKAIRGGVPVIFPQFSGFGTGQRHGFARSLEWQMAGEPQQEADNTQCTFTLEASAATLALWPFHFRAEFTPVLADDQLSMTLTIRNTDNKPFTFTAALHTYFAVSDIHQVQLLGLKDVRYWDNNGSDFHQNRFTQTDDTLNFPDAIDRVYFDCQQPLELIDGTDHLQIHAMGFNEVVVWNPGAEATKKLDDMADYEYQRMLCVEAATIDQPITLAPGETWSGAQVLRHI